MKARHSSGSVITVSINYNSIIVQYTDKIEYTVVT
jgi:hypothetical protein